MKKHRRILLGILLLVVLLAAVVMAIPALRARALFHAELLWIKLDYFLHPPEKNLFTPATLTPGSMTATPPSSTPTPTVTPTPEPVLPTPTMTPTPLPEQVMLEGVIYQTQKGFINNCAPSNLFMALTYWGWRGDVNEVSTYLKPLNEDKNVMPYEMANYVEEKTEFETIIRYGGTIELLKKLVAGGYPVLIEKGTYARDTTGRISWMGHYALVTGYDDAEQVFITQDSLLTEDYKVSYDLITTEWRGFDYVFIVIYPEDRADDVINILGVYSDEVASYQIAAETASVEAVSLTGNDQFHAWFNRGTSLQLLQDYYGSAAAYDQAFQLLPLLKQDSLPWRIVWYQTGPYFSYYYTGRYQDLIDLATTTINVANRPSLEESFYWRALGYAALGDMVSAKKDFCASLRYHKDFPPTLDQMQNLGITECQ